MSMTEERMQFLEEQIPYLAEAAFKQAYLQALASGSSVLISEEEVYWSKYFLMGHGKCLNNLNHEHLVL